MINWKVRFKNPIFYMQILVATVTPIFAYMGITASEITSWDKLLSVVQTAISNPYILFLVATSIYNAIIDPTTIGIGDSKKARTYNAPTK